ncbi:MAG: hypothetical protein V2B15_19220 [Bacteroidota bacterium]
MHFGKMARRKRRFIKVVGWILAGFLALIIVVMAGFYMGRGVIMQKALSYVNESQPGEVQMDQINLIPFMDFPRVALQLRSVRYYEKSPLPDSSGQDPILSLDEVYVSLDVIDLVRGNLDISQVRLVDGFVILEVQEDSVTNLEKALGIRFGTDTSGNSTTDTSSMGIDLERIEMTNILAIYNDLTSQDSISIKINKLESRFSYLDEVIEAGIELNIDINTAKYQTYKLESKNDVNLESQIYLDKENKILEIAPSSLRIAGLELETWGNYNYLEEPIINLEFKAVNTGLEVLNFLLYGILDLDQIEQIGSGTIRLDGNVTGRMDHQIPLIRVNGSARKIGFRVKTIDRDVTGISFDLFATNGSKTDLSEAYIEMKDFRASTPDGNIMGNIVARNRVIPEIDMQMKGEVDLEGLDQILKTKLVGNMTGHLSLEADLRGVLDRSSDEFLNDAGKITAKAEGVGFITGMDTIREMSGELYMEKNLIGTRDMNLVFNGNQAYVEVKLENVVHYLLGYDRDIHATFSMDSEVIFPGRIFRDTVVSGFLGEELRGLHFGMGASIGKQELDNFINNDSIPEFNVSLDSFGIELPFYAKISDLNAALTFGPDTISLQYLDGLIGQSAFSFSGQVVDYEALVNQDSGGIIGFRFRLASRMMRAADLFNYRDGFLLPEVYQTEYLEDFHLTGSLQMPVTGLISDSADLDFGMSLEDLGWKFRYYPLAFNNFNIRARKKGNELFIDEFKGEIGESNFSMSAMVGNYTDSLRENLYGNMALESDLLDFNELLNYQLPEEMKSKAKTDSLEFHETPALDQMDYPDFNFNVNIGELRFGSNKIFGMKGKLRSSSDKIFYFDRLETSGESGGTIVIDGQFNVANPLFYNFSAKLELKNVNIRDLDFEMETGDETYRLKENFKGVLSGNGLAEVFITPDLKLDIPSTTAVFNMEISDGALINFTPLKAAGKFLDNKDLNHVRFSTLRNSFTLVDSRIIIPLMIVESTLGQLLIEGEQGLDQSYLYLLRVPNWLVKEAAWSRITGAEDDGIEDEIHKMKTGKFMMLTPWSDGVESRVRLGDKRDKYR